MQTLKHIKLSNRIKWYFVKLTSPITSFKKWLLTDLIVDAERLEHRVDNLENNVSVDDIDNRVDNLEYDLEARIESVEDRSETNQESINIIKDDVKQVLEDVRKIIGVDFEGIAERFNQLEGHIKKIKSRMIGDDGDPADVHYTLFERILNDYNLDFTGRAVNMQGDLIDKLNKRVNKLEEDKQPAKKASQLEKERQSEEERSEQSLSDIQRLTFEICHYYGGEFDVNDFDNCYEIVNEYDVVWKRNPQPKKHNKNNINLNNKGGQNVE